MKKVDYDIHNVIITFNNQNITIQRHSIEYINMLNIIKDTDIYTTLINNSGSINGSITNIDDISLLEPFFNRIIRQKKLNRIIK